MPSPLDSNQVDIKIWFNDYLLQAKPRLPSWVKLTKTQKRKSGNLFVDIYKTVDENLEVLLPKLSTLDLSEDEIHCKQDFMLIAFLNNRDRYDLRDFEVPLNQQKNSQPKLFLEPIINQIDAIAAIMCNPAASTLIKDE